MALIDRVLAISQADLCTQRSSCFSCPSAGITGTYHQTPHGRRGGGCVDVVVQAFNTSTQDTEE